MAPSLLGGWIWGTRALPITINCGQSWLVLANQCQSHANPVPIKFQSRANQMPIQGHSLNQSRINLIHFFANSSQSNTNLVPIWCQSKVNLSMNLCQSVPICANPCQSANPRPIGQSQANPPIRCQSYVITEAIPALNLGTSALYGKVPSPLGGRFQGKLSRPLLQIQC